MAADPEVVYIQPAFGGEPPPDMNPNNDVAAGGVSKLSLICEIPQEHQ